MRFLKKIRRFYEELLCATELMTADITSPMLIIHGDSDDIVPISHVNSFKESHKNATLKIICGADHRFKNSGETEAVINFTTEFLDI
jgi:alpha/beta superfamily hydrolase